MKIVIFLMGILVLNITASATAYTYCENGNLYQCGGGDACHPEPCQLAGSCNKEGDVNVQTEQGILHFESREAAQLMTLISHSEMCL